MTLKHFFDGRRLSVPAALELLCGGGPLDTLERRVIADGFLAWMLAPDDPAFVSMRMFRQLTLALAEIEDPSLLDRLMDGSMHASREEAVFFSRMDPENEWIVTAYEELGGDARLRRTAFDPDANKNIEYYWNRALRVVELFHAVHFHASILYPRKDGYSPPGVERARQLVSARSKKTSTHVSTSSLHRAYWLPVKSSAAWLYALLYKHMGPRSAPTVLTGGPTAAVKALQLHCRQIAGRCRFIEETILPQLLYVSEEHRPARTVFPDFIVSVPFAADDLPLTEDELKLFRDGRLGKAR